MWEINSRDARQKEGYMNDITNMDIGEIEPLGSYEDYISSMDDEPADEPVDAGKGKKRTLLPDKIRSIADDIDRLASSGRNVYEQQAVWGLASMAYETAEEIAYRRRRRHSRAAAEAASRRQYERHTLDFGLPD